MRQAFFILLFLLSSLSLVAQHDYVPTKENLEAREWFEDAKFGLLFIGAFTVYWVMVNG